MPSHEETIKDALQAERDKPRLFFENEWERRFFEWVDTEQGRQVAYLFIRIACAVNNRNKKIRAKAICERIRWHYFIRKRQGEAFVVNNNFTAYLARFAVDHVPALKDFFEMRELKREDNHAAA